MDLQYMLGYVDDPEKPTDLLRHRFPSKVGGAPVSDTAQAGFLLRQIAMAQWWLHRESKYVHNIGDFLQCTQPVLEPALTVQSLIVMPAVHLLALAGLVGSRQPAHPAAADLPSDGPDHEVPAASVLPRGQQPSGRIPQERVCLHFTQGEQQQQQL